MPSLKKNFFYSGFLTTANYIFPLLTYPYVSRVLGVTNIGLCNFVDSIVNYFILFSMMGINIVGIREVAACKGNRQKLSNVFNGLLWLNTITTIIALVVLVVTVIMIEQLREHWDLMVVGAIKLATNFMLIEWFYKGLEEFKFITIRTLIVKILYVSTVFIFVNDRNDLTIYYLLTVLMITVNALINIIYSKRYVSFYFRGVEIRKYFKSFLLLGIYMLLTSMYTTFNVAYLGFVAGETEVGYYTTASKLFQIFIALFTAFTGVMLPRMSSLLSEGKVDEFKKYLSKSVEILYLFSVPIVIVAIVYAPVIIRVMAGEGYEGAILPMRIIIPMVAIIGYEQIIIVQGLMPLKQDKAILKNSLFGALAGITLNIMLVSSFKSIGSSIVWIVSEIVVLIGVQYCLGKSLKIVFPWKSLLKHIAINIPLAILIIYAYISIDTIWKSVIISSVIFISYELIVQFIMPNEDVAKVLKTIPLASRIVKFNKE